jgi:biotin carboxyl carrier protein
MDKAVEELQQELTLLKSEIKETLIDVREHLLNTVESPFAHRETHAAAAPAAAPAPVAAPAPAPAPAAQEPQAQQPAPQAPAAQPQAPAPQAGQMPMSTMNAHTWTSPEEMAALMSGIGSAAMAGNAGGPGGVYINLGDHEDGGDAPASGGPGLRKRPSGDVGVDREARSGGPGLGAGRGKRGGGETGGPGLGGRGKSSGRFPRRGGEADEAEEAEEIEVQETASAVETGTPGAQPAASGAQPAASGAAPAEGAAAPAGAEADLMTVATLGPWLEQAVGRLGRKRTRSLLEVYASMGGMSTGLRDVLLTLVAMDDTEGADEPASVADSVRLLADLDDVMWRSRQDWRRAALMSMVSGMWNPNGPAAGR